MAGSSPSSSRRHALPASSAPLAPQHVVKIDLRVHLAGLALILAACDGSPTGQPPPTPPPADHTPPSLVLFTPDTLTGLSTITLRGSASDNVKVTRVTYQGTGDSLRSASITPGASVEFQIPLVNLPQAGTTFTVVAYDSGGNASPMQHVRITSDVTPPFAEAFSSVFVGGPAGPALVYGLDAGGPGAFERVTYEVEGQPESAGTLVQANDPYASFTLHVALPEGTSQVLFHAYDHVGNRTTLVREMTRGAAATSIASGGAFSCATFADGATRCWGVNNRGQLGSGSTGKPRKPGLVSGGQRFTSVTAGLAHACGLAQGGAAYCWGNLAWSSHGQANVKPQPQRIPGDAAFVQLSAGAHHTCGLDADGGGWCWGVNDHGELGDGTRTGTLTPVPIAGNLRFQSISAGGAHTCAVTTDGDAYCWGDNYVAQLGNGTSTWDPVLTPGAVLGGIRFRSISAGLEHTCAVAVDDAGYCWGYEQFGRLGNSQSGGHAVQPTPLPIDGGLRFGVLNARGYTSCGLTVEGRAYCWGSSTEDAVGTVFAPVMGFVGGPVRAAPGLDFDELSTGWGDAATDSSTCGMSQGSVLCWGKPDQHQLGW